MEEIMKIALANIGTVLSNRTSFNDGTHDTSIDLISMYDAASPELKKQLQMNFNLDSDLLNFIYDGDSLVSMNHRSITHCRTKLKIKTDVVLSSDLNVGGSKTELLVNLCKEVGATTYLSGKGGLDYLDKDLFKNIKLEIFKPKVKDYYTTLCHI